MEGWRQAFALSKDELAKTTPPGTSMLMDRSVHASGRSGLRGDHVQLVPTPSQSPNDPLNWHVARKIAILATMSFYAFTADFATGVVAPSLPILAYQIVPPRSFAALSKLVSVSTLLFGLANVLWVPLANIYGRRPVLILSLLIFTLGSMWCGLATSFDSLLAARAVQGLGGGTSYTLAPDIIGEVFFVHERGRALAIYTACVATGPFVGGVTGSYIAANLGYKYMFWISTAAAGATLILQLLLVPETLFKREAPQHETLANTEQSSPMDLKEVVTMEEHADVASNVELPYSYRKSLGFASPRGHWAYHFAAPWRTLALPGTWMVMLLYGALVGGVVSMATVGPIFLAMPPYSWGASVGLINLGGLVGAALGGTYVYFTSDYMIKRQARTDSHGFSEPETRLPIMFPGIFVAVTGLWTFGFCAANPSPSGWAGLVVGSGMLSAGLTVVPAVGFNYILDAYLPVSTDCFVMVTTLRAIVGFAWTYFVTSWVEEDGAALPFGIFGMISAVFGLVVVPMWLFGKRTRIATARYLPKESNHG